MQFISLAFAVDCWQASAQKDFFQICLYLKFFLTFYSIKNIIPTICSRLLQLKYTIFHFTLFWKMRKKLKPSPDGHNQATRSPFSSDDSSESTSRLCSLLRRFVVDFYPFVFSSTIYNPSLRWRVQLTGINQRYKNVFHRMHLFPIEGRCCSTDRWLCFDFMFHLRFYRCFI